MIKIFDKAHSTNNNLIFCDNFQNREKNLILLTYSPEISDKISQINNHILSQIFALEPLSINDTELEEKLQSFFVELNWQINNICKKINTDEIGISLLLLMTFGNEMYIIQFGRLLLCTLSKNETKIIGSEWKHFSIKSKDELNLLGSKEQDIQVKINKIQMDSESYCLVIPADIAEKLLQLNFTYQNFIQQLDEISQSQNFPYLILKSSKEFSVTGLNFRHKTKIRVTAFLMIIAIIISVIYVIIGNNALEDRLNIKKEIIQEKVKTIDFKKLQENLHLDYGLLFVPARSIKMKKIWSSELPFEVTYNPLFDFKNFYLISKKQVFVYDKGKQIKIWNHSFDQEIIHVNLIDLNRIIILTSANISYCFNRENGEILWEKVSLDTSFYSNNGDLYPQQISLDKDKRLNNSILLFPSISGLILRNIANGDSLSGYSAKDKILYNSEYDIIEKSIYLIEGKNLVRVNFEIKN